MFKINGNFSIHTTKLLIRQWLNNFNSQLPTESSKVRRFRTSLKHVFFVLPWDAQLTHHLSLRISLNRPIMLFHCLLTILSYNNGLGNYGEKMATLINFHDFSKVLLLSKLFVADNNKFIVGAVKLFLIPYFN